MTRKLVLIFVLGLLLQLGSLAALSSANYKITTGVVDAGQFSGGSASYRLLGKGRGRGLTTLSSASFKIGEGFLKGAYVPVSILAPLVTGIVPAVGVNTGLVNITNLSGANFASGAAVKLVKSGESDLVATNVTVVSSAKITCTFDLTGAAVGAWAVVVTNVDGQAATLPQAFKIEAPDLTVLVPVESSENPFNPRKGPTTISYSISKDTDITVYIYNLRGERVWQYNAPAGSAGGSAGANELLWSGVTSFRSTAGMGVYVVHVVAKVDGQIKIISKTKVAIIK